MPCHCDEHRAVRCAVLRAALLRLQLTAHCSVLTAQMPLCKCKWVRLFGSIQVGIATQPAGVHSGALELAALVAHDTLEASELSTAHTRANARRFATRDSE